MCDRHHERVIVWVCDRWQASWTSNNVSVSKWQSPWVSNSVSVSERQRVIVWVWVRDRHHDSDSVSVSQSRTTILDGVVVILLTTSTTSEFIFLSMNVFSVNYSNPSTWEDTRSLGLWFFRIQLDTDARHMLIWQVKRLQSTHSTQNRMSNTFTHGEVTPPKSFSRYSES